MQWARLIRYTEFWPSKVFQFTLLWSCPFKWRSAALAVSSLSLGFKQMTLPVTLLSCCSLSSSFHLSRNLWGILWLLIHTCFMIFLEPFFSNTDLTSPALNCQLSMNTSVELTRRESGGSHERKFYVSAAFWSLTDKRIWEKQRKVFRGRKGWWVTKREREKK